MSDPAGEAHSAKRWRDSCFILLKAHDTGWNTPKPDLRDLLQYFYELSSKRVELPFPCKESRSSFLLLSCWTFIKNVPHLFPLRIIQGCFEKAIHALVFYLLDELESRCLSDLTDFLLALRALFYWEQVPCPQSCTKHACAIRQNIIPSDSTDTQEVRFLVCPEDKSDDSDSELWSVLNTEALRQQTRRRAIEYTIRSFLTLNGPSRLVKRAEAFPDFVPHKTLTSLLDDLRIFTLLSTTILASMTDATDVSMEETRVSDEIDLHRLPSSSRCAVESTESIILRLSKIGVLRLHSVYTWLISKVPSAFQQPTQSDWTEASITNVLKESDFLCKLLEVAKNCHLSTSCYEALCGWQHLLGVSLMDSLDQRNIGVLHVTTSSFIEEIDCWMCLMQITRSALALLGYETSSTGDTRSSWTPISLLLYEQNVPGLNALANMDQPLEVTMTLPMLSLLDRLTQQSGRPFQYLILRQSVNISKLVTRCLAQVLRGRGNNQKKSKVAPTELKILFASLELLATLLGCLNRSFGMRGQLLFHGTGPFTNNSSQLIFVVEDLAIRLLHDLDAIQTHSVQLSTYTPGISELFSGLYTHISHFIDAIVKTDGDLGAAVLRGVNFDLHPTDGTIRRCCLCPTPLEFRLLLQYVGNTLWCHESHAEMDELTKSLWSQALFTMCRSRLEDSSAAADINPGLIQLLCFLFTKAHGVATKLSLIQDLMSCFTGESDLKTVSVKTDRMHLMDLRFLNLLRFLAHSNEAASSSLAHRLKQSVSAIGTIHTDIFEFNKLASCYRRIFPQLQLNPADKNAVLFYDVLGVDSETQSCAAPDPNEEVIRYLSDQPNYTRLFESILSLLTSGLWTALPLDRDTPKASSTITFLSDQCRLLPLSWYSLLLVWRLLEILPLPASFLCDLKSLCSLVKEENGIVPVTFHNPSYFLYLNLLLDRLEENGTNEDSNQSVAGSHKTSQLTDHPGSEKSEPQTLDEHFWPPGRTPTGHSSSSSLTEVVSAIQKSLPVGTSSAFNCMVRFRTGATQIHQCLLLLSNNNALESSEPTVGQLTYWIGLILHMRDVASRVFSDDAIRRDLEDATTDVLSIWSNIVNTGAHLVHDCINLLNSLVHTIRQVLGLPIQSEVEPLSPEDALNHLCSSVSPERLVCFGLSDKSKRAPERHQLAASLRLVASQYQKPMQLLKHAFRGTHAVVNCSVFDDEEGSWSFLKHLRCQYELAVNSLSFDEREHLEECWDCSETQISLSLARRLQLRQLSQLALCVVDLTQRLADRLYAVENFYPSLFASSQLPKSDLHKSLDSSVRLFLDPVATVIGVNLLYPNISCVSVGRYLAAGMEPASPSNNSSDQPTLDLNARYDEFVVGRIEEFLTVKLLEFLLPIKNMHLPPSIAVTNLCRDSLRYLEMATGSIGFVQYILGSSTNVTQSLSFVELYGSTQARASDQEESASAKQSGNSLILKFGLLRLLNVILLKALDSGSECFSDLARQACNAAVFGHWNASSTQSLMQLCMLDLFTMDDRDIEEVCAVGEDRVWLIDLLCNNAASESDLAQLDTQEEAIVQQVWRTATATLKHKFMADARTLNFVQVSRIRMQQGRERMIKYIAHLCLLLSYNCFNDTDFSSKICEHLLTSAIDTWRDRVVPLLTEPSTELSKKDPFEVSCYAILPYTVATLRWLSFGCPTASAHIKLLELFSKWSDPLTFAIRRTTDCLLSKHRTGEDDPKANTFQSIGSTESCHSDHQALLSLTLFGICEYCALVRHALNNMFTSDASEFGRSGSSPHICHSPYASVHITTKILLSALQRNEDNAAFQSISRLFSRWTIYQNGASTKRYKDHLDCGVLNPVHDGTVCTISGTRGKTNPAFCSHRYLCYTCDVDNSESICKTCALQCHAGHIVSYHDFSPNVCGCRASKGAKRRCISLTCRVKSDKLPKHCSQDPIQSAVYLPWLPVSCFTDSSENYNRIHSEFSTELTTAGGPENSRFIEAWNSVALYSEHKFTESMVLSLRRPLDSASEAINLVARIRQQLDADASGSCRSRLVSLLFASPLIPRAVQLIGDSKFTDYIANLLNPFISTIRPSKEDSLDEAGRHALRTLLTASRKTTPVSQLCNSITTVIPLKSHINRLHWNRLLFNHTRQRKRCTRGSSADHVYTQFHQTTFASPSISQSVVSCQQNESTVHTPPDYNDPYVPSSPSSSSAASILSDYDSDSRLSTISSATTTSSSSSSSSSISLVSLSDSERELRQMANLCMLRAFHPTRRRYVHFLALFTRRITDDQSSAQSIVTIHKADHILKQAAMNQDQMMLQMAQTNLITSFIRQRSRHCLGGRQTDTVMDLDAIGPENTQKARTCAGGSSNDGISTHRPLKFSLKKNPPVSCAFADDLIHSVAVNPANPALFAVCEESGVCFVFGILYTGQICGRVKLGLEVEETEKSERGIVWLPDCTNLLAIYTHRIIEIYDIFTTPKVPKYRFRLAEHDVAGVTFIRLSDSSPHGTLDASSRAAPEWGVYMLVMSKEDGSIVYQQLGPDCQRSHQPIVLDQKLQWYPEKLRLSPVNGQGESVPYPLRPTGQNGVLCGGGRSLYYVSALGLLLHSYRNGQTVASAVRLPELFESTHEDWGRLQVTHSFHLSTDLYEKGRTYKQHQIKRLDVFGPQREQSLTNFLLDAYENRESATSTEVPGSKDIYYEIPEIGPIVRWSEVLGGHVGLVNAVSMIAATDRSFPYHIPLLYAFEPDHVWVQALAPSLLRRHESKKRQRVIPYEFPLPAYMDLTSVRWDGVPGLAGRTMTLVLTNKLDVMVYSTPPFLPSAALEDFTGEQGKDPFLLLPGQFWLPYTPCSEVSRDMQIPLNSWFSDDTLRNSTACQRPRHSIHQKGEIRVNKMLQKRLLLSPADGPFAVDTLQYALRETEVFLDEILTNEPYDPEVILSGLTKTRQKSVLVKAHRCTPASPDEPVAESDTDFFVDIFNPNSACRSIVGFDVEFRGDDSAQWPLFLMFLGRRVERPSPALEVRVKRLNVPLYRCECLLSDRMLRIAVGASVHKADKPGIEMITVYTASKSELPEVWESEKKHKLRSSTPSNKSSNPLANVLADGQQLPFARNYVYVDTANTELPASVHVLGHLAMNFTLKPPRSLDTAFALVTSVCDLLSATLLPLIEDTSGKTFINGVPLRLMLASIKDIFEKDRANRLKHPVGILPLLQPLRVLRNQAERLLHHMLSTFTLMQPVQIDCSMLVQCLLNLFSVIYLVEQKLDASSSMTLSSTLSQPCSQAVQTAVDSFLERKQHVLAQSDCRIQPLFKQIRHFCSFLCRLSSADPELFSRYITQHNIVGLLLATLSELDPHFALTAPPSGPLEAVQSNATRPTNFQHSRDTAASLRQCVMYLIRTLRELVTCLTLDFKPSTLHETNQFRDPEKQSVFSALVHLLSHENLVVSCAARDSLAGLFIRALPACNIIWTHVLDPQPPKSTDNLNTGSTESPNYSGLNDQAEPCETPHEKKDGIPVDYSALATDRNSVSYEPRAVWFALTFAEHLTEVWSMTINAVVSKHVTTPSLAVQRMVPFLQLLITLIRTLHTNLWYLHQLDESHPSECGDATVPSVQRIRETIRHLLTLLLHIPNVSANDTISTATKLNRLEMLRNSLQEMAAAELSVALEVTILQICTLRELLSFAPQSADDDSSQLTLTDITSLPRGTLFDATVASTSSAVPSVLRSPILDRFFKTCLALLEFNYAELECGEGDSRPAFIETPSHGNYPRSPKKSLIAGLFQSSVLGVRGSSGLLMEATSMHLGSWAPLLDPHFVLDQLGDPLSEISWCILTSCLPALRSCFALLERQDKQAHLASGDLNAQLTESNVWMRWCSVLLGHLKVMVHPGSLKEPAEFPCITASRIMFPSFLDYRHWQTDRITKMFQEVICKLLLTSVSSEHLGPSVKPALIKTCREQLDLDLSGTSSPDEMLRLLVDGLRQAASTNRFSIRRLQERRLQKFKMQLDGNKVSSSHNLASLTSLLPEEEGIACAVCSAGFRGAPKEQLGFYVFVSRSPLEAPLYFHGTPESSGTQPTGSALIGRRTTSNFVAVHYRCHTKYLNEQYDENEWGTAQGINFKVPCNGILPILAPPVGTFPTPVGLGPTSPSSICPDPDAAYVEKLESYTSIVKTTLRSPPEYVLAMHDVKLLLSSIACNQSFQAITGGASRERNLQLLPHLMQVSLHSLLDLEAVALETEELNHYLEIRETHWLAPEHCWNSRGPLFQTVASLHLWPRATWLRHRVAMLRRLVCLARGRLSSFTSSSGQQGNEFTFVQYKPYLLFHGVVDAIYQHVYNSVVALPVAGETTGDIDWCAALSHYIRTSDALLHTAVLRMLNYFTTHLIPVLSVEEYLDVLNLTTEVDISELTGSLMGLDPPSTGEGDETAA